MKALLSERYWRNLGTSSRPFYARLVKGGQRESDVQHLPNVWLGVSVEDQRAADERIPLLLRTPAAVRFLSMEPLLGPVDLWEWVDPFRSGWPTPLEIDWVIAGGESGPGARPMHPDWVRSIRDQCTKAYVPFFFKQWGEWALGRRMIEIELPAYMEEAREGILTLETIDPSSEAGKTRYVAVDKEGRAFELLRVGKKAAGRLLDGREWNEYPEVNA